MEENKDDTFKWLEEASDAYKREYQSRLNGIRESDIPVSRLRTEYLGELPEGAKVCTFRGKLVLASSDRKAVVVHTAEDVREFCKEQECGTCQ